MAKYNYEHHPHTNTREHASGLGQVSGLNNRIGLMVTKFVGSMWAAYLFAGLALISLPAAIGTGDVRVIVDWVAQTFLQLVLVSVVIVGQNQMNQAAERRAEATYKDATALLHEVQQLQQHLAHQDAELEKLRKELGK
jgi:hypothetical protein